VRLLFLEQHPCFIGGSERMSLALCRHARARGHAAWLVHAEPGDMVAAYAAVGAPCRQLPVRPLAVRHPVAAWRSFVALRGFVRQEGIDLVFTSLVSYVSLLGALGSTTRIRTVVHLGLPFDFASPLFRTGVRRIDLGVAPSPHTAADWRERGWPAARIRIIPNGVDTAVFSPGCGREEARQRLDLSPTTRPLVAYVGRLVAEKGIFTLMRAMAQHRRAGGTGFLLFGGAAPAAEVEQLAGIAREEHLAEKDWAVRPATSTPEDIYRAADLVVVPSEWEEPFGLVPLEAMACGTLAVVSDRGILPEFVAPLRGEAVFPAGRADALAGRLSYWLASAERRNAAAAQLAAHTRDHYGFQRCGDAYLEAFQGLLH
jgi:glycosyltransferase involved in cell wall biosynthesis